MKEQTSNLNYIWPILQLGETESIQTEAICISVTEPWRTTDIRKWKDVMMDFLCKFYAQLSGAYFGNSLRIPAQIGSSTDHQIDTGFIVFVFVWSRTKQNMMNVGKQYTLVQHWLGYNQWVVSQSLLAHVNYIPIFLKVVHWPWLRHDFPIADEAIQKDIGKINWKLSKTKPNRVPSHYLIQCWNIVNWTSGNKFQWNLNQNLYIFIQENAFENVVWNMVFILSRPQCVKPQPFWSGPHCNTKMSSYQYRKSHHGDNTIFQWSYLHNGISYTGKKHVYIV